MASNANVGDLGETSNCSKDTENALKNTSENVDESQPPQPQPQQPQAQPQPSQPQPQPLTVNDDISNTSTTTASQITPSNTGFTPPPLNSPPVPACVTPPPSRSLPSLEEQSKQFESIMQKQRPMKSGDHWFVLSSRWFTSFKEYAVGNSTTHREDPPGLIDNSELVLEGQKQPFDRYYGPILKQRLVENFDFVPVPEVLWELLLKWYGGGPPIPRYVIEEGMKKFARVEIYPLCITTMVTDSKGHVDSTSEKTVVISKRASLLDFKRKACGIIKLDQSKTRVWLIHTAENIKLLKNENQSLEQLALTSDQKLLLEQKLPNGDWARKGGSWSGMFKSFMNFIIGMEDEELEEDPYALETKPQYGKYQPGQCGLHNLGNTCFMNSALQCMSNTAPIVEYFLSDAYKSDINTTNPLGMKGQVAEQFGILLKQIWSGGYSAVAPRNFKWVISKYAPQFSGYSQHDSQELLSFLLDGLHEDLNRISKKPYCPTIEANGRPDEEVAAEAWQSHLKRNQSKIVELYQGQLKSTIVCPDCHKVSITFDPFMYLSLPLPISSDRILKIVLVRLEDTALPIQVAVKVPKLGVISDLKAELFKLSGIPPTEQLITNVYGNKIYSVLTEQRGIAGIFENDITMAFQVPPKITADLIRISFAHRKVKSSDKTDSTFYLYANCPYTPFGNPFTLYIHTKTTGKEIYELVWKKVCKFTRVLQTENLEVGPFPTDNLPFLLSVTTSTCMVCGICNKKECWGCHVDHESSQPFLNESVAKLVSLGIAIDWNSDFIHDHPVLENSHRVDPHPSFSQLFSVETRTNSLPLAECLRIFTTNEQLGPEDAWYCPTCLQHKQAFKKFDLWKLPPILVVHLKRFVYTRIFRDKIGTVVDFPLEWDVSPYLPKSHGHAVYRLFAVSNHSGGLGGGHYTACCRNKDNGMWYNFNDSSCSRISPHDVRGPAAYVLFYQRTSIDECRIEHPLDTHPATEGSDQGQPKKMQNTIPAENSEDVKTVVYTSQIEADTPVATTASNSTAMATPETSQKQNSTENTSPVNSK